MTITSSGLMEYSHTMRVMTMTPSRSSTEKRFYLCGYEILPYVGHEDMVGTNK